MSDANKFWIYDITQLFRSFDLIPQKDDTLSVKLNTIMRLTLVACTIISTSKPMLAFAVLLIVAAITTSVHAQATQPTTEGFEETHDQRLVQEFMKEYTSVNQGTQHIPWSGRNEDLFKEGFPITQKRFCNDAVPWEFGPSFVSPNQMLHGGPNPKTKIPPLVAAPSHDLSAWKDNDFVIHSAINARSNFDVSRSGYDFGVLPTKCNDCLLAPCRCGPPKKEPVIEHFRNGMERPNLRNPETRPIRPDGMQRPIRPDGMQRPRPGVLRRKRWNIPGVDDEDLVADLIDENNVNDPAWRDYIRNVYLSRRAERQAEDDAAGLTNREYNAFPGPSAPPQEEKPKIRPCFETARRDNLLTQTLQPGVFQKSHVAEPIQSNIGISFTQGFVPTGVQETDSDIKFTQYNPSRVLETPTIKQEIIPQTVDNVYDPRFTGYGTSYRSYVDKMGRPQFFYDDINSVTMPNYITRSKVDVFPWAGTYGPDTLAPPSMVANPNADDTNDMNAATTEYRQLANNAFTDSTIQFRTEMQERLMRKRNAELWQQRAFPISTMNKTSYLAR